MTLHGSRTANGIANSVIPVNPPMIAVKRLAFSASVNYLGAIIVAKANATGGVIIPIQHAAIGA